MKKVHAIGFLVLLSVLRVSAAPWTLDDDKKKVSDGVWTFNVSKVDETKKEIQLGTIAGWPSTLSDLDLSAIETCGYKMISYGQMKAAKAVLASVKFPATGVTVLANQGFKDCTSLTNVVISSDVTTVNYGAFWGCTSLVSISPFLPDTVTKVDSYAFKDCAKLAGALKLRGVKTLGGASNNDYCFSGCSSLTSVDFGSDNVLTTIGARSFESCTALASVTPFLPPSVTFVGDTAFTQCKALSQDLIATNATTLMGFNQTGITSVRLSDKVVKLGSFASCTSLTNVTPFIPATVANNAWSFQGCTKLTGDIVVVNTNITKFAAQCFKGTGITSITLPPTFSRFADYATFASTKLTNISVYKEGRIRKTPVLDGLFGSKDSLSMATEGTIELLEVPFRGSFTMQGEGFFRPLKHLKRIKFFGKAPTAANFKLWYGSSRTTTVCVSREQDETGWLALPTTLYSAENPAPADAPANCFGSAVKADYGAPLWFVWERSPYDPPGLAVIVK